MKGWKYIKWAWGVVLFILLVFTISPLEILVPHIRNGFVIALYIVLPTSFIVGAFRLRKVNKMLSIGLLSIPILAMSSLIIEPFILVALTFESSTGPWQTIHVEYQNKNNPNYFMGIQLKDIGALGYRRRKAKIREFGKYFHFSVKIEDYQVNEEWVKVDLSRDPYNWK